MGSRGAILNKLISLPGSPALLGGDASKKHYPWSDSIEKYLGSLNNECPN